MTIRTPIAIIFAFLLATSSFNRAWAENLLIKNARIHTMTEQGVIKKGSILIKGKRIVSVGKVSVRKFLASFAKVRTIDAQGRSVTPGLINSFTRLGLMEISGVSETNDSRSDNEEVSAAFNVAPGINHNSEAMQIAIADGITRAWVVPGTGYHIFAGLGADIAPRRSNQTIIIPKVFEFVTLGEVGARQAGGSRGSAMMQLKASLYEAQAYSGNRLRYQAGNWQESLINRLNTEALLPVIRGKKPLLIKAERASDLRQIIALKKEFPVLRIIIAGAAEGWMVARELARANIPVITGGMKNLPRNFETMGATLNNVGRMHRAGVLVALGSLARFEGLMVNGIVQEAGNLVGQGRIRGGVGLSHNEALKLITSNAARIMGIATETGSIAPGKTADLVIWSGDPLEVASSPDHVIASGKEQSLVTRQTLLSRRYKDLKARNLPYQYGPEGRR